MRRVGNTNPCSKCGKPWSEGAFSNGQLICKACDKEKYRQRYAKHKEEIYAKKVARRRKASAAKAPQRQALKEKRASEREKINEHLKAEAALRAEQRERVREERRKTAKERKKEYREKTKERWKAHAKEHRAKNKDRYREIKKRWLKNNPDKRRAKQRSAMHRRRAAKRGAGGKYKVAEVEALFTTQRGKCAECRVKMTLSPSPMQRNLDHVQPLALGGSNGIENLQWLCQKCNNDKGAMDPYEWAALHGKLFI